MTVLFFTATGNSLYVARRIGGELLSIPRLVREHRYVIHDNAVGVVCPVYAGEMPKMVRRFLENASIRTDYFFFVQTYGMYSTTARAHAVEAAKGAGLTLDYAAEIRMVDNYLDGFEMGDQIKAAGEKNIEGQIEQVCRDIETRVSNHPKVSLKDRAGMAVLRRTLVKSVMRDDASQRYIVNDRCVKCGVCAQVCPANNIRVGTNGVEFGGQCEVCYACLHNCPQNAIHLPREQSAARFRNENVTLRDIVNANSDSGQADGQP